MNKINKIISFSLLIVNLIYLNVYPVICSYYRYEQDKKVFILLGNSELTQILESGSQLARILKYTETQKIETAEIENLKVITDFIETNLNSKFTDIIFSSLNEFLQRKLFQLTSQTNLPNFKKNESVIFEELYNYFLKTSKLKNKHDQNVSVKEYLSSTSSVIESLNLRNSKLNINKNAKEFIDLKLEEIANMFKSIREKLTSHVVHKNEFLYNAFNSIIICSNWPEVLTFKNTLYLFTNQNIPCVTFIINIAEILSKSDSAIGIINVNYTSIIHDFLTRAGFSRDSRQFGSDISTAFTNYRLVNSIVNPIENRKFKELLNNFYD